ncbi:MAG: PqqD family peptide modification chaperone [Deltaproteobacteria bacterium]|nr:PqqD family peptide modification chaperone [Deltaproteobacteria bacterium]
MGDKKLTIGMATYDDYDGVYFTVQAIRLYHPEVKADTELLVIDNHPTGPCAQPLQMLANWIEGYRYVPYQDVYSTAVRDLVFREARTPYVLCVDSHVLLMPGSLQKLITYFDQHPDCQDLLQGPLLYDDLKKVSTHFKPVWSQGMYGQWGTDERGKDPEQAPFAIPMQGLGLFACRRDAWLGFNPRFRGYGGEEGYIHEKFRQAGRRTLCLPFLRWVHRFNRPLGPQYQNKWADRIWNYFIGFTELGWDTAALEAYFRERLGAQAFERIARAIRAELENPFFYFDAIYCINLDTATDRWQAMQTRFTQLGIVNRVRRFPAIETPDSHHIGCTLSHRRIVERAQKQQWQNVLVFEDDAIFLEDTLAHVAKSLGELKTQDWQVFHLGGCRWGQQFPKASGCRFLASPGPELTCSHAVAYHQSVYQRIVDDLPGDIEGMREWIKTSYAIDQYLGKIDKRYLAAPVVSSQPFLLAQEEASYRDQFTLGSASPSGAGIKEMNIPRHSVDYQLEAFESELLLYHPAKTQAVYLNETAALIWRLCNGQRSVAEIKTLLQDAYPEMSDEIAQDLQTTLEQFVSCGALDFL